MSASECKQSPTRILLVFDWLWPEIPGDYPVDPTKNTSPKILDGCTPNKLSQSCFSLHSREPARVIRGLYVSLWSIGPCEGDINTVTSVAASRRRSGIFDMQKRRGDPFISLDDQNRGSRGMGVDFTHCVAKGCKECRSM